MTAVLKNEFTDINRKTANWPFCFTYPFIHSCLYPSIRLILTSTSPPHSSLTGRERRPMQMRSVRHFHSLSSRQRNPCERGPKVQNNRQITSVPMRKAFELMQIKQRRDTTEDTLIGGYSIICVTALDLMGIEKGQSAKN